MRRTSARYIATSMLACTLALSGGVAIGAPTEAWAVGSDEVQETSSIEDVSDTQDVADTPEPTHTPLAVTFYAAESEVEGVMSDQVDWSGAGIALNPCTYTRAGYHFAGWQAATAEGAKVYADGATIPATDFGEEGLLQLVALWEPNTYTLQFDLAGGFMDTTSLECTYGEYVTYPVPVRGGYVFSGWTLANGVTLDEGNRALLSTFNGDTVTLTATWEAATATIAFDPNYPHGSSGPELESVTTSMTDGKVSLPALELEGYEFLGWSNGSDTVLAPGSHAMAEAFGAQDSDTATLLGVWQPHTYSFVCDFAGGVVHTTGMDLAASMPLTVEYGELVLLPTPTREGYVLAGWYDQDENVYGLGEDISNLTAEDGATVHLTALWQKASPSGDSTSSTTEDEEALITPRPYEEENTTSQSTQDDDQSQTASATSDSSASSSSSESVEAGTSSAATSSAEPSQAKVIQIEDDATAAGTTAPAASTAPAKTNTRPLVRAALIVVGAIVLLAFSVTLIRTARKEARDADGRHFGGSDDS